MGQSLEMHHEVNSFDARLVLLFVQTNDNYPLPASLCHNPLQQSLHPEEIAQRKVPTHPAKLRTLRTTLGIFPNMECKNPFSGPSLSAYGIRVPVKIHCEQKSSYLMLQFSLFGQPNTSVDYDNELTLKIEKFLIDNFLPNAQLDDLAQYLCLSHRQTDRLLKRLFNKSYQEIKNETRITKAKDLIHKKEHSLKEIASILGYSSYIGFYKSFRQATGLTPEEYRDSLS